MKTKFLWLGLVTLVAACGVGFGRMAWRVHRQVVTLHVRNMPLAEVLHKIERQTWQKIRAEQGVDTRVTLNVDNLPLSNVLDLVGEQAGARWSRLYAVYGVGNGLKSLETALRGDGKLEPAGWTRVSPTPMTVDVDGPGGAGRVAPDSKDLEDKLPPGAVIATTDAGTRGSGRVEFKGGGAQGFKMGNGPMTMRVVRKGAGGGVDEEVWMPETLVMESTLKPKLGTDVPEFPTPVTTAAAARKVNGHWTTYFAFHKAPFTLGFGGGHFMRSGKGVMAKGTNQPGMQGGPPDFHPPSFDEMAKRENERFARLTPEQRVQRARDRLGFQQK